MADPLAVLHHVTQAYTEQVTVWEYDGVSAYAEFRLPHATVAMSVDEFESPGISLTAYGEDGKMFDECDTSSEWTAMLFFRRFTTQEV